MTENNNNLNEEQLKEVTGGTGDVDKDYYFDIDQAIQIIMKCPDYNEQHTQIINTLVKAKELATVHKEKEALRLLDKVISTADKYFDKEIVGSIYYWLCEASYHL